MTKDKTEHKQHSTLEVERSSVPNTQAMIAVPRVVLDLPKIPIVLEDEKRIGDTPPSTCYIPRIERICDDAQPVLDPESVERFCRVWAEVGRVILARRSK